MKALKKTLMLITLAGVLAAPARADLNEVVELYNQGRYTQAAEILEKKEEKDDKMYYYLGLIYYRSGKIELARKAFLSSWYLTPNSRWGKASYKNWLSLSPSGIRGKIRLGMEYDTNIMHAPDYFPETSDAVLSLTASLRSRPGTLGLDLGYDRKQNILDGSSLDALNARLNVSKKKYDAFAGAEFTLFDFSSFYNKFSVGLRVRPLSLKASRTRYLEQDYTHLSNTSFSAGITKNLGKVNASYRYKNLNAKDKDTFYYYVAEVSEGDESYDFKEKIIEEGVFETFSYDSHRLSLFGLLRLGEGKRIRAGVSAERRFYAGKDKGFHSHWKKEEGQWSFWNDEADKWEESNEAAPGEKQISSRRDTFLSGNISLLLDTGFNTETEVFYRYENNSSPRDEEPFFKDRHWQKHSMGVYVSYSF